jgi:glycosyltransferase involved in cell wall biosynthesis
MNPKVSIIVPIYNVERYLDRCVQSLVNQTLHDIEIILVDDESPDNCPAMCDVYEARDSRIKVVHKKNGGLGMACNSGLEVAKGEYVAFCDSDDWVELNTYELMYNAAIRANADAVFTGIKTIDDVGVVKTMNCYDTFEVLTDKARIQNFAMDMISSSAEDPVESHIAMSAKIVLYRRSLIESNKLKFVSERQFITEDLIWNLDVLGHASVVVKMPEIFYFYYNNTSSISKKVRTDRFHFFISNRLEIYRRTALLQYPCEVNERIDRMFIRYVRHQVGDILMSSYRFVERKKIVSEMLTDKVTQEIIAAYPTFKLPKLQQIIIWLMKHNCQMALLILFRIRR